jgi:acyl-CoA reductase-like NAD-dependent aldehyde dehydrogenase
MIVIFIIIPIGKCPTIVDKDVNMDNAVLRIAQGRYTNAG